MSLTYKHVALNTILLYSRTFLSMIITLYSSRILLEYIGVTDFGIFSIVGGVVIMFGFFNNAMSASTQRFITIEKSKDKGDVNTIFSVSIIIHFLLAIIVVVFLESIGLWYLNNELVIPEIRINSTNVLFHVLTFNLFISIINVPFNAILVAYERMKVIALVGILESIMKLGGILLLPFINYDRLIIYSFILLLISLINRVLYIIYCRREFKDIIRVNFTLDKVKIKEMLGFASWNLFGVIAAMGYNQGVNLVLNSFFGVIVNAARGIAFQVYQAFYTITSNIQLSTNTFIIGAFVNQEDYETKVNNIIRFLIVLLLVLIIPFFINAESILLIWLGNNIPKGAVIYTKLLLLDLLITMISGPLHTLVQADGRIRKYQTVIGFILLLNIPLSLLILRIYSVPELTFVVSICLSFGAFLYRLFYVKKIFNYDILKLGKIIIKLMFSGLVIYFLLQWLNIELKNVYLNVLVNVSIAVLTILFSLFIFSTSKLERNFILNKIKLKFSQ